MALRSKTPKLFSTIHLQLRSMILIIIHEDDGSASVQYFTQEDGSVVLDPDVKVHFPDSESVNKALRSLIA
jgi:hypothetical protein